MAYRVKHGQSPAENIARIVRDQADKALADLRADDAETRREAPHEARKRFKKIRAALRLVRDEIGEDAFQAENAAWRDAGRRLAGLREAEARLEIVDWLKPRIEDAEAASALESVGTRLKTRYEAAAGEALADDAMLAEAAEMVDAAKARIDDLPIGDDGFGAFKKGLKRVYKRGGTRGAHAFDSGAPEDFHDWRKRVKYLWLQMRILKPINPDELDAIAVLAKQLADILGDDHDLTELARHLTAEREAMGGMETLEPLLHAIAAQSVMLRAEARPMFQQLYAEKPKAFVKKIEGWWEDWAD